MTRHAALLHSKHCGGPAMTEHSTKSQSSFPLWFLTMIGITLALLSVWVTPASEPLPYSDFKTLLRQGRMAQVQIGAHTIQGTLRSASGTTDASTWPQRFVTVRVEDPTLLRDLEAGGVQYRGQYENAWVTTLLGWLIPLGLGVVLWIFLSRHMGFGQGVMPLGKSRARV